jgi:hypothetical protein
VNLTDGYNKAKTKGSESRDSIKESAPKLFRNTFFLLIGVTSVFWLINKGGEIINRVQGLAGSSDSVSTDAKGASGINLEIFTSDPSWLVIGGAVILVLIIVLVLKSKGKSLSKPIVDYLVIGSVIVMMLKLSGCVGSFYEDESIADGVSCSSSRDFHSFTISDTTGTDLTLCSGYKAVTMTPRKGMCLKAEVSPVFERQYGHLLTGKGSDRWKEFAGMQLPKTYPGSSAEHWRFVPITKNFVRKQSFEYIILNVRSVRCK